MNATECAEDSQIAFSHRWWDSTTHHVAVPICADIRVPFDVDPMDKPFFPVHPHHVQQSSPQLSWSGMLAECDSVSAEAIRRDKSDFAKRERLSITSSYVSRSPTELRQYRLNAFGFRLLAKLSQISKLRFVIGWSPVLHVRK
jgi:hypothetical protein